MAANFTANAVAGLARESVVYSRQVKDLRFEPAHPEPHGPDQIWQRTNGKDQSSRADENGNKMPQHVVCDCT